METKEMLLELKRRIQAESYAELRDLWDSLAFSIHIEQQEFDARKAEDANS